MSLSILTTAYQAKPARLRPLLSPAWYCIMGHVSIYTGIGQARPDYKPGLDGPLTTLITFTAIWSNTITAFSEETNNAFFLSIASLFRCICSPFCHLNSPF